jgi:hypothetical protein
MLAYPYISKKALKGWYVNSKKEKFYNFGDSSFHFCTLHNGVSV